MRAFEGFLAVVTGAGSGVGAAIALAMARGGADLCLVGRRMQLLEGCAESARGVGAAVSCYATDLASEAGQSELVQRISENFSRVDVLVNNAGLHIPGSFDAARLEDFDEQYRVNVRAPYALAKGLLPLLKVCSGQVVFVNSSSGIRARPLTGQYDASKHALKAVADSYRDEVNATGVRVLSVYLGRTASSMQARIHLGRGVPYRPEILIQPEDVASIVVSALALARTAEVTDVHIRPMIKT